jgi:hypothetical protein
MSSLWRSKMKRSEIIKKALNHELNTVCVNEEQVERMLEIFEKLGMLPPQTSKPIHHYNQDALQCLTEAYHKWESEDEEK